MFTLVMFRTNIVSDEWRLHSGSELSTHLRGNCSFDRGGISQEGISQKGILKHVEQTVDRDGMESLKSLLEASESESERVAKCREEYVRCVTFSFRSSYYCCCYYCCYYYCCYYYCCY